MLSPSTLSFDAIREYAERVGYHHEIYDDKGQADVRLLFTKLGGSFAEKDRQPYFIVEEAQNFTLSSPSLLSERRQLFRIAQTLGFYYLHYLHQNQKGKIDFGLSIFDDVLVTQANVFASALLMPALPFEGAYIEHKDNKQWDWVLADIFQVSPKSVRYRVEVLGLKS